MSFPKREEIEVLILAELKAMGGEGATQDIYRRVAKHFPQIWAEGVVWRMLTRGGFLGWDILV